MIKAVHLGGFPNQLGRRRVTQTLLWALLTLGGTSSFALAQTPAQDLGLRIMADRAAGNCISCHEIPAWREANRGLDRITLQGDFGPSLQGVALRYSAQQLRQWVVDARVLYPDTLMPPYGTTAGLHLPASRKPVLSPGQIEAVVQTLASFTQGPSSGKVAPGESSSKRVLPSQPGPSSETMTPVGFWIEQGRQRWSSDCAACHPLAQVLSTVGNFPRLDSQKRLINLEDQIANCRQRVPANFGEKGSSSADRGDRDASSGTGASEDNLTLALSAFLLESVRGRPVKLAAPFDQTDAKIWHQNLTAGEQLFQTRIGHLNLSCQHCHDGKRGASLRAQRISPGQPLGFPAYRISWEGLGSIDRRLRACFSGVQAQVPEPGDTRLRQLELYLKHRAEGLPSEGPMFKQ
jgi:sulfur-oxidizing protein SoxA